MENSKTNLEKIKSLLENGLDNAEPILLVAGTQYSSDDLNNVFAIYAPFGDVDITLVQYSKAAITATTLLGGSQIFGRPTYVELASGSNPILAYVKK